MVKVEVFTVDKVARMGCTKITPRPLSTVLHPRLCFPRWPRVAFPPSRAIFLNKALQPFYTATDVTWTLNPISRAGLDSGGDGLPLRLWHGGDATGARPPSSFSVEDGSVEATRQGRFYRDADSRFKSK